VITLRYSHVQKVQNVYCRTMIHTQITTTHIQLDIITQQSLNNHSTITQQSLNNHSTITQQSLNNHSTITQQVVDALWFRSEYLE
jgi:hypothetical protein